MGNMYGQRSYTESFVMSQRNAVDAALEENSQAIRELGRKMDDLSRREEAHVRRLGFSVDMFGRDVRGLTLAKQRY